jgi:O-antigen/teichoic acid export membrane protein
MFSQLLKHTSNYTIANILMVIAGLVSFPILTRVLSITEYGVMSFIAVALTLLVAVGKMGMQHATLRFHSEVKAGKRNVDAKAFLSTAILGTCVIGLCVTLLWALISQFIPQTWLNDARLKPLLLLTSVLILVRVCDSALINQLRAQERSGVLAFYSVVRRYVQLALLLTVLLYVAPDVWGFFVATIAGEVLALVAMATWMFWRTPLHPSFFSPELMRAMLSFGLPMLGYELSSVLLSMGDRYIIQKMLGANELGIYSAAYNMCDYIKGALLGSMIAAIQPMYMRLWEEKGVVATSEFLQKFIGVYMMLSMLVIAGMAAIGGELLSVLASQKYRAGEAVVPWVMAGMAIESVVLITGAGLYIQKRSKIIMLLVFLSAVLNLGLNVLLLPSLGLVGAGVATLVSYVFLMLAGIYIGRSTLPLSLPLWPALKFGGIALVMYFSVMQIKFQNGFFTLGLRTAAGLLIYAVLVLALDHQARSGFLSLRHKMLQKLGRLPKVVNNVERGNL